jgi:phytoene synthase
MRGADDDRANADYCANLVRDGDFERYAATLFVAPEPRRALFALYAFNLEIARIREHISQPLAGEIRLQWWSDLLAGIAHGEAAGNPVAAELIRAIEHHKLPREPFEHMIAAHRFDLYDEPMQTMAELENYLEGTASALFSLGTRVLDMDAQVDGALLQHAGLAFGTVRIIEALPRHTSRGQLYLPLTELIEAQVVVEDLFAGKSSQQLQMFLQSLAQQARVHLKLALGRLAAADTRARKIFLPLALIDRHLRRLTSAAYQPFDARSLPSNLSVLWTLWRAARREPFRR